MATGRLLRGIGRIVQSTLYGVGAFVALAIAANIWAWGYDLYVLIVGTVLLLGLAWVVGEQP